MRCVLRATGAHNLLKMWWYLTDDGRQRLTQSRGETSSSLTDDGLDDDGSLQMGSRWANKKSYVTMNCASSKADVTSELDVQALVSLHFYHNKLSHTVESSTYDTLINLHARDVVNNFDITHVA